MYYELPISGAAAASNIYRPTDYTRGFWRNDKMNRDDKYNANQMVMRAMKALGALRARGVYCCFGDLVFSALSLARA